LGIFDDVASSHSFRAGKLQVRSTQYWVSQMGTAWLPDSDYQLKLGRWCTHGLQAHEIQPIHYVILSGGILHMYVCMYVFILEFQKKIILSIKQF
jgi:hypothetical protein